MGEVFITRKGGGGKASAPTIAITEVGGTWIELEITNNDAAPTGATIFILVNYDPTSETDFDIQASQNGFVFAVAEGATVTQLITGLDPDTSHTVSGSAAVIKKLPSSIVTTDTINLDGTGVTAPTIGPIVSDTFVGTNTTLTIAVANSDTTIPLIIKANFTTSTTPPTTYPFETASLAAGASTNLTLTGLTVTTEYYIHARAFDGTFSSSNVVFGPYTTDGPLYAFTTATFTNGGQTGRTGPSLTQARNGLTGPETNAWKNNTQFFNTTSGIQLWTVPANGIYQFTVTGAQGGLNTAATGGGGNPARIIGRLTKTKGEILRIVTGQAGKRGSGSSNLENSSGGGGSFVYSSSNELFFAAGAGGGGSSGSAPSSCNANTGTSGRAGTNSSGDGNGQAGGTNGNRGNQSQYAHSAGAGGGWSTTSLELAGGSDCGYPGGKPTNGGGRANNFIGGWGYSSCQLNLEGGFGGGGGGAGACCTSGSGGGGGYSGGGVGVDCCESKGGGGGSFINSAATNTSSSIVSQLNGSVTIQRIA